MKKIHWLIFTAVLFFGFFYHTALAQTEAPISGVSDISIIKVVEQADSFLKSDSFQKTKDKILPFLAKIDAWRGAKVLQLSALKEKADPESFSFSFYSATLKAFSSKSMFYGGIIFLALIILSRVKKALT